MIKIKKIQKINTPDGHMIPIYRDWDVEINEGHQPKMVYASTLLPKKEKEIILHKRRTAYLTCIHGRIILEAKIGNNFELFNLSEMADASNQIDLLIIPENIPIKIKNPGNATATLINCTSPSWHADDPDTIKFRNWKEFEIWKTD